MRRLTVVICCVMALIAPGIGHAGDKEEYDQAYKLYMAVGACMAAYSDRYGSLASRYLEQDGWQVDNYHQVGDGVDARFVLAKKQMGDGQPMYVLAFVGTENAKDMQANLKVEKVYFAGSTLEEFAANAAKQGVPPAEPKVHRGFHEFVQAGLTAKTVDGSREAKYLTDMLLENKDRKIYIVGHSRGGAAATIAGARLISMGVGPEQIEIITFGAPAVGNEVFAAQFDSVLHLTRVVISGDPVTGVLQTLVGGYKQFGREILWEAPDAFDRPHELFEYADLVIKNYYNKRQQAVQAGVIPAPACTGKLGGIGVYVAPLKNSLPPSLAKEFWYFQQVLWDDYRKVLPVYLLGDEKVTGNLRKKAAVAGAKWLVVPEVEGHRAKDEKNVYYITFSQTLYDVTSGSVVNYTSSTSGTFNLTPMEAFIHGSKGVLIKLPDLCDSAMRIYKKITCEALLWI